MNSRMLIIIGYCIFALGCHSSIETNIIPLDFTLNTNHVSIYGGSDGSIDLEIISGNEPYNFEWSNGKTTEDLHNLKAGRYSVIVSDFKDQEKNMVTIVDQPNNMIDFPVNAEVLVSGKFTKCEGIAFNGENKLFVAGDHAVWEVSTAGECNKIFSASSNVGLAPVGEKDLLFADFGPTNAFANGPNNDGIVWRLSPSGNSNIEASGIGDPNFITVLNDGSFLVSDDATDEIFIVDSNQVSIFTNDIKHPNGMVLSLDGTELYVAQIFRQINPYLLDGRIWAIKLENNLPVGKPSMLVDLGDDAANDGLALDILGRIYVACWYRGEIWRYDISSDELVLICKNLPGVASIAFGRGEFDTTSIYATSTRTGKVWKVPVGIQGANLNK